MFHGHWNGHCIAHNGIQAAQNEWATDLSQSDGKPSMPLMLKSIANEWTHNQFFTSNLQYWIYLEKEYALFIKEIENIQHTDKNKCNASKTATRNSFICTHSLIICNDNTSSFDETETIVSSDDENANSYTFVNNYNDESSNKIKETDEGIENIHHVDENNCNAYKTVTPESFICADSLIICDENTSKVDEVETIVISSDDENSNSHTFVNKKNIKRSKKLRTIKAQLDGFRGVKCRAPFKNGLSPTILCNAVIMSVTMNSKIFPMTLDNFMVTVLYLYPTSNSMVPCKYWTVGKCMYSDQDCEFSHGTQIPMSSLLSFLKPDFEHLKEGSFVLANTFKDGLWANAVVLYIENGTSINDTTCVVQYDNTDLGVSIVSMHDIYPLISQNDDSDNNNEGIIVDNSLDIFNKQVKKTPPTEYMGNWEKHTKGIGSKIMAKMGYVKGTGLGKNKEGRVEPVVATLFPKGKSLDYCIAIKNTNHRKYLQRRLKTQRGVRKNRPVKYSRR